MSYRSPADGLRTCRQCGADLAEGASFCAECGTPQRVARPRGAPPPAAGGTPPWLPVAIIGGIAAIAAGVVLALLLGNGRDAVTGQPTPSASATASIAASSSTTPSESAEPTATPVPTPVPAAIIPNRAIASVATDALNLRSQPNESATVVTELAAGQRVFVVGEPTTEGEMHWYRVATLEVETCVPVCGEIGYAATPVVEGDPWLEEAAVECPASPMTSVAFGALAPLEALHCYGRNEIVITGTVDTPCCGFTGPYSFSPDWLATPAFGPFLIVDGSRSIGLHFPEGESDPPERGEVIRAIGHLEDPAATSCRANVDPSAEDVEPINSALMVLTCRARFVLTDHQVTGHEDLGPCCGGLPAGTAAIHRDRARPLA